MHTQASNVLMWLADYVSVSLAFYPELAEQSSLLSLSSAPFKCYSRSHLKFTCWCECRLEQPVWKTVWSFLTKLKMELPYGPAIPLLGIHVRKPKTLIRKNICSPMSIAVLFTIARIWKQPKGPSVDEWIKKLSASTQRNTTLAKKQKEILPFATAWVDLENVC